MKRGILSVILLSLLLVTGCRATGYFLYVLCPWLGDKTVYPEYEGLKNKSVAVVVYADENAQYIYPPVQLELSAMVSAQLQKHIKGVTTLDPRKVVAYQRSNLSWDEMPLNKVASDLDVDYVLFISLIEFSTVEEGYLDLLRAKITGEVRLYERTKEVRDGLVWQGEDVRAVFPESPAARASNNEQKFRMIGMQLFAQNLVRKFYKHKVKIEKWSD